MNSNDIDVEIPDEWWNMTNLEVLHLVKPISNTGFIALGGSFHISP